MQTETIKLIWDFKGEDAAKIAEHHAIHLKEFAEKENLTLQIAGSKTIDSLSAIAFLAVTREEMPHVRDLLKPHRGELFMDN
ncbi:MAG: hypothetical protein CO119_07410 [Flavobacteriales bacterium CG_4_9_14_3_um_filter_40_17]|nr:MAG: hypothetical protein CO119_07410 [Flavobacteriales bacterium CG_4_9_14_3_um_filter_40_17]